MEAARIRLDLGRQDAVASGGLQGASDLHGRLKRIWQLTENSTDGRTFGSGAGIDSSPALTDDQALRDVLRRLIAGIDGNTDPAPADNLLMALRGTVVATTDRNVIDSNISKLTELLTRLTEIRDKLV
jgi:hypothetical protein